MFVAVTTAILFGTLYPSEKLSEFRIIDYDKIGHFLMFFIWTFLFGLMRIFRTQKMPNIWVLLLFSFAFGILIEILQYYLPINRSSELFDLIADALGSLTAIPLLKIAYKKLFVS